MKNCGIICEYNPFHTGHAYQIDRVRSYGFDNIVCVMSGAFVQSALPAFCDKAIRGRCAVLGGADAVIELPTVYSTASAQIFAEGGIKILRNVVDLTHIAMGARAEREIILKIADIKIANKPKFRNALKHELDCGKSYNIACTNAIAKLYSDLYGESSNIIETMSDPNNMLCIEYITAIDKFCANIQPMIIERKGAAHNDLSSNGEYISATSIRNAAANGKISDVMRYIPYCSQELEAWNNVHYTDMTAYKQIAVFALNCADTDYIGNLRNCSEGLEFLLKKMPSTYDFDKYIDGAVNKRYGKKRIYRLLLDILLGIDKACVQKRFVTRLLACKKSFDFGILPNFVKTNNSELKCAANEDAEVNDILNIDIKATALFNTVCRVNGDYFNYSLVKE